MKFSIIIPTYNEEEIIVSTVKVVSSYLTQLGDTYEIIISDDGSTDQTKELVDENFHDDPHILILNNPHKGKGHAIRRGIEESNGKYLYLCDADLSTPIEALGILISKLNEGYDIAIASREGELAQRIGEPIYRHLMGRGFNLLVKLILDLGLQDTQCGFKLFKSEVAKKLFSRQILYSHTSQDLTVPAVTAYDVEVLFLAKKYGYKVIEVPVAWEFRPNTRVNALRDSSRNLADVIKVKVNDLFGKYETDEDPS